VLPSRPSAKYTSVEVSGLSTGVKAWKASGTEIALAYARNADAIKPSFNPLPDVFQPKATEPRKWVDADWSNQKDPVRTKLAHEWSHREHWGFSSGDTFARKAKANSGTTGT
jgi:hypothetical protein